MFHFEGFKLRSRLLTHWGHLVGTTPLKPKINHINEVIKTPFLALKGQHTSAQGATL